MHGHAQRPGPAFVLSPLKNLAFALVYEPTHGEALVFPIPSRTDFVHKSTNGDLPDNDREGPGGACVVVKAIM